MAHDSEWEAIKDDSGGRMASDVLGLLARVHSLEGEVEGLSKIVVGPKPEMQNGLRRRLTEVERAIQQITLIKWGVVALILMKSPDIVAAIKPILAKF